MKAIRGFQCLATALLAAALQLVPAHAEGLGGTRNSLGLNLGRDKLVGSFWGLELGYIEKPRLFPAEPRVHGLNLRLVGSAPFGESFGIFGKVGTNYARSDAAAVGGAADSMGFSFGAGVSYTFTPRLSATLEWESSDLRFSGALREPVRSTSLGLRWRY